MKSFLLAILLCLTAIWFYVGFIRKETEHYLLPRLRGAFFIFLALTLLVLYTIFQEHGAAAEVAKHIMPYSGKIEAIYVPTIPGNKDRVWMFETDDTPEQVETFYANQRHTAGWVVTGRLPLMILKRNNKELIISATSRKGKTIITYQLSTSTE